MIKVPKELRNEWNDPLVWKYLCQRGDERNNTSFAISDILTNSSQAQPRTHAMFSWWIVVFSFQGQVNWKLLCMNVRLNHWQGTFASGYRNRKAILPPNVWSIGQFFNLFRLLLLLLLRPVKRRGSNKGRSNNKGRPRHFSLNAKPGEKVSLEGHEPRKVAQATQKKIYSRAGSKTAVILKFYRLVY